MATVKKRAKPQQPSAKQPLKRRRMKPKIDPVVPTGPINPTDEAVIVDSAEDSPSTPKPTDVGVPTQTSDAELAPVEAAGLYASAMERGRTIGAEHLKTVKPLREVATRIRSSFTKTMVDARQDEDETVDSLRFDLPDGSSRHLTTKTNTTYQQVKRDQFAGALRYLKAEAVHQIHETKPQLTMGECLAEAILAKLKLDLSRTNTQAHWTKGPPAKSWSGQETPVVKPAPPEMVEQYTTLQETLAEIKTHTAAKKEHMAEVQADKRRAEAKTKEYLSTLKNTQQTITVSPLGKPNQAESYVLRLRHTNPRAGPSVTIKKMVDGVFPLTQVTAGVPKGDAVEFSLEEVRALLIDAQQETAIALVEGFDTACAKFATVHAKPSKAVLRLVKARSCGKKAA